MDRDSPRNIRQVVAELTGIDPDDPDPHGFHEMTERELIDWLASGKARPESVAYRHGENILRLKQREAERDARASERATRFMDDFMDELSAPAGEPNEKSRDRLTEAHIAIVAFPFAVFAAVVAATGSVAWSLIAAFVALGVFFVRPLRDRMIRFLGKVIR